MGKKSQILEIHSEIRLAHFSLAKTFLQSYQGISANFKLDGGSHQTFLVINLLSIKVFILEGLRLNSYDKNLLYE